MDTTLAHFTPASRSASKEHGMLPMQFIFSTEAASEEGFVEERPCALWGSHALWRPADSEAVPGGGASYWSPRAGGVVNVASEAMDKIREWDLPNVRTPRASHIRVALTHELVERNLNRRNNAVDETTLSDALRFDQAQSYATRANRLVHLFTLRMLSPQYPIMLDDNMVSYALAFMGATDMEGGRETLTLLLDELADNKVIRHTGDRLVFLTKADQHLREIRNRRNL